MRVLTTTMCYPNRRDPDRGVFVQRRTLSLLRELDGTTASGVCVQVVSPQPWFPLLRPAIGPAQAGQSIMVQQPRMVSLPLLSRFTDGRSYANALVRCIRSSGGAANASIDLIDAHFEYPDGVGAYLAGKKLGIPVVVTVRGKIVALSRCPLRRRQICTMLNGVDAIVAVSESLAEWVRRVGGQHLAVHVIPNGIDTETFNHLDRTRCRAALNWSPNARYVLAVGHFQHIKGFDRLVRILPELRQEMGDVRLVLVGSQRGERSYQRKLLAMIQRCNVQTIEQCGHPAIQIVGPVTPQQLNCYYNGADLLASTSRSEGWCNAICEALAAGLPVVATDVGGNREQICTPMVGRLVPDGNETALRDTIFSALHTDWNRDAIARFGSRRSWLQVGHEVRQVFQQVLTRRQLASRSAPPSTLVNPDARSGLRLVRDTEVTLEGAG